MKTVWTSGLTLEQKKEMTSAFTSAGLLRERLSGILEDKIETNRNGVVSKTSYDNPNWAYLQADAVGYERAIKEIISLLLSKKDQ